MHQTPDGWCCPPLENAHNPARLLRVFIGGRLANGRDLPSLRRPGVMDENAYRLGLWLRGQRTTGQVEGEAL
jgi:hypothetical protein